MLALPGCQRAPVVVEPRPTEPRPTEARPDAPPALATAAAPSERFPDRHLADRIWTVAEMNALPVGTWLPHRLDLAPARWIWLPSGRTLANTFVLFRRELTLDELPR